MDHNEPSAHARRVYAALHLRSLEEFRRNLEELRKAWDNALKRHEARRPGLMHRVFTKDRAYREWSDKRDALFKNLSSCVQRIRELSAIIAAGGESPEVGGYVDALLRDAPDNAPVNQPSAERSSMQTSRPA